MIDISYWLIFLLIMVRMTAFMIVAPFFSIKGIPVLVKVGLGFFIAVLLMPVIASNNLLNNIELISYILLIIKETLIGLTFGFTVFLVFQSIKIAGQLIDIQIGLSMASLFDPQSGTNSTLIGQFLYTLAILDFMIINAHHTFILSLAKTYEILPIGGFKVTESLTKSMIDIFRDTIIIGMKIALPIIAVLIIIDISLGLVARTVPQLNVFMLGFPLKIGIGIVCLAIISPIFATVFQNIFSIMEKYFLLILRSFR